MIIYVGHEVFEDFIPFSWIGHRVSHLSFLSSNLVGACMWMLIAYYWYFVGFFVKIIIVVIVSIVKGSLIARIY